MAKPLVLKVNGKEPFSLYRTIPAVSKIKAFLDKQPDDEIYTSVEIINRVGIKALKEVRSNPVLCGYVEKVGNSNYWGNPRAIKALREQVSR